MEPFLQYLRSVLSWARHSMRDTENQFVLKGDFYSCEEGSSPGKGGRDVLREDGREDSHERPLQAFRACDVVAKA